MGSDISQTEADAALQARRAYESRRVRRFEVMLVLAIIAIVASIINLSLNLPVFYRAQNWDVAWIGFDAGLLAAVITTFLAIIKRRQVAIPASLVAGTMLIVDSWFDTSTAQSGRDFYVAFATAVFLELPFSFFLFRFSRNAMRRTLENAYRKAGVPLSTRSLLKTPLTVFREES